MNVLITGSSSGIGHATVLHLARQGHVVFASVRDLGAVATLKSAAQAEELSVRIVSIDVTSEVSVREGIDEVLAYGQIDVLINNAGVGGLAAIEETTDEQLQSLFDSNFLGPLRLIRGVLPGMRDRRSGVIVNVSSLLGRLVFPPLGPYAASKYALEAACESLAQEVRSYGIRVAIVEPGLVITPMLRKHAIKMPPYTLYADQYRRAGAIFRKLASMRTSPEDVAVAIEHAIETDEPKLRYLVGADARVIAEKRAEMSDEDWLGPNRRLTDAEWFYLAEQALGIEFQRRLPARAA